MSTLVSLPASTGTTDGFATAKLLGRHAAQHKVFLSDPLPTPYGSMTEAVLEAAFAGAGAGVGADSGTD